MNYKKYWMKGRKSREYHPLFFLYVPCLVQCLCIRCRSFIPKNWVPAPLSHGTLALLGRAERSTAFSSHGSRMDKDLFFLRYFSVDSGHPDHSIFCLGCISNATPAPDGHLVHWQFTSYGLWKSLSGDTVICLFCWPMLCRYPLYSVVL